MFVLMVFLVVLAIAIYPVIGILLAGGFKKLDKNIFGIKPQYKGYSGSYYNNTILYGWIVAAWPVFLLYIALIGIPALIFYYPFIAYRTLYKKVISV